MQFCCSCSRLAALAARVHVTTRRTTCREGAWEKGGRPRAAQLLGWAGRAGWSLGCLAARPSIACSDNKLEDMHTTTDRLGDTTNRLGT